MFKLQWKRFLLTLLLLAISCGVWPQSSQKVPRIGVVAPLSPPPSPSPDIDGFRRGLKELGYVEGQSIIVEYRWGRGRPDKAIQLAVELARLDLDALVVAGPISAAAANRASSRTPVVFAASGVDPVSIGLVASFARPGGNITGLAMMATELAEKRLELMRDTVPGLCCGVARFEHPGVSLDARRSDNPVTVTPNNALNRSPEQRVSPRCSGPG